VSDDRGLAVSGIRKDVGFLCLSGDSRSLRPPQCGMDKDMQQWRLRSLYLTFNPEE
jgi:hypothetical protein